MRFSTRSFFLVIAFYGFFLAITFSLQSPFGLLLMNFLALLVLPPFVQVGVITTRGLTRGFFIGTAVAGIPHFVFSLFLIYYAIVAGAIELEEAFWTDLFDYEETCAYILVCHLIGITFSSIGGLSGFISYGLLHGFFTPEVTQSAEAKIH